MDEGGGGGGGGGREKKKDDGVARFFTRFGGNLFIC